MFWGEVSDAQARASLRNALPVLRKQLGQRALAGDRENVALDPAGLWVDAFEFQAQAQALLAAGVPDPTAIDIDLYRGDLLADFYDEWIGPEREALRGLYLKVLLRLARQFRAQGEYRRAIQWAEKLLAIEPTTETAHRQIIACHLALGDREAALRQYETCLRVLRDELGVEPQAETRALYDRLRRASEPAQDAEAAGSLSNLPAPLTSFVGREQAVAAVAALLSRQRGAARLVTLTGPGGCGKTRLAIQAAAAVAIGAAEQLAGGVWWVELAALADSSLVPATVAKTLGLRELPGEPLGDQLLRHLRQRHCLIVLDNCEHLIRACAELAGRLLPACPGVQILCTSREALGVTGETTWPVPPLSVAGQSAQGEAVRLFVERAAAIRPNFALTDQTGPLIARICRQLDGLPLAIELAAARTRALTLQQIAERLDDRFNLLTGGSRAALPRQQTLRATMDWSYDLLDPAEQTLFRRLAVFAGGFGLEAIDSENINSLTRLVDQSLVIAEEGRYQLLETVRQYAADKLWLSGEELAARRRHLRWCADLAERMAPELRGPRQAQCFDELDREQDNFRAALRLAAQDSDSVETGLKLAGALWPFWAARGYLSEGRARLAQLLALPAGASQPARGSETEATPARAAALLGAGGLAIRQGDFAAARPLFEASLRAWRALGDAAGIATAEHYLGWTANAFGEYDLARALYSRSLAARRGLGPAHQLEVADSLSNLGMLAFFEGNYGGARRFLEESVALMRDDGEPWARQFGIYILGSATAALGDFASARALLTEALALARQLKDKVMQAYLLEAFACLVVLKARQAAPPAARAEQQRAAQLMGAAAAARRRIGSPIPPQWQAYCSRLMAEAGAGLGEAGLAAATQDGEALDLETAAEYAVK